jgi:hypothetical protein
MERSIREGTQMISESVLPRIFMVACVFALVAGAMGAGRSVQDIWGSPLTAGELVEQMAGVLESVPIRNPDTQVLWYNEPWCAIRVETDGYSWPASPLAVIVGSVMKVFPGAVTIDPGVAVATDPGSLDDAAASPTSTPLIARNVAIVQGYVVVAPPGIAVPAIEIVTVVEKDGVFLEVLCGSALDSNGLSVSSSVPGAAGATIYTFHWVDLPAACAEAELLVVTCSGPLCVK